MAYYRHHGEDPAHLVNDTGTGNTLACDHPIVEELVLDALRHFVVNTGVDGFRFDLAPVLGRTGHGFDRKASLLHGDAQGPGAEGPGDDRRALGHRSWRLSARQFSDRVRGVERQVP